MNFAAQVRALALLARVATWSLVFLCLSAFSPAREVIAGEPPRPQATAASSPTSPGTVSERRERPHGRTAPQVAHPILPTAPSGGHPVEPSNVFATSGLKTAPSRLREPRTLHLALPVEPSSVEGCSASDCTAHRAPFHPNRCAGWSHRR
jgi:hypothetical protein